MKLTDAKIWVSKNASLCQVFAIKVAYLKQQFDIYFYTVVLSTAMAGY